jgi:hypothetical protein
MNNKGEGYEWSRHSPAPYNFIYFSKADNTGRPIHTCGCSSLKI